MEDKDMHRKELALPPGSKAYFTAIRTGVCNAYLAGSVVDSRLVRTSKTGGMSVVSADLTVLGSLSRLFCACRCAVLVRSARLCPNPRFFVCPHPGGGIPEAAIWCTSRCRRTSWLRSRSFEGWGQQHPNSTGDRGEGSFIHEGAGSIDGSCTPASPYACLVLDDVHQPRLTFDA